MSELTVQNIQIKVRPMDSKAAGFMPRYRQLLAARRALETFDKAQPEDIDETYKLLAEHITEPTTPAAKQHVLDMLSADDLLKLFDVIMGANTVNPPSGAA